MQTDFINIEVIKATTIEPFMFEGGRNLHFHYFVKTPTGWDFRWVDEQTTSDWLKEKIAEGIIYIFC